MSRLRALLASEGQEVKKPDPEVRKSIQDLFTTRGIKAWCRNENEVFEVELTSEFYFEQLQKIVKEIKILLRGSHWSEGEPVITIKSGPAVVILTIRG